MCKYLKNYWFWLWPFFLAVLCSKIGAATHIEKAFNSGHIDQDSALLYALSWARDWRDVPKQFQQKPDRPFCGTTHVVGAVSATSVLGSDFATKVAKRVQSRPTTANQTVSPSGKFNSIASAIYTSYLVCGVYAQRAIKRK